MHDILTSFATYGITIQYRKKTLVTLRITSNGILTQFLGVLVRQFSERLQEGSYLVLKRPAVVRDLLHSNLARGWYASGVHDTAPVGHLVFVGILRVIVIVDRVHHAQVQK